MNKTLSRVALGLFAAVAIACGGGKGGGGGTPAVVLQYLLVTPSNASIDIFQAQAFTCIGHYSDGTEQPLAATWDNDNPNAATLDTASGTVVVATAKNVGTVILTAGASGMSAQATVNVVDLIPADPGPVYGDDFATSTIVEYPALGSSDAPTTVHSTSGLGYGILQSLDGSTLYFITGTATGYDLHRFDLATSTVTATIALGEFCLGLDRDSDGNIYTCGYDTGDIKKIDPALSGLTVVGNIGTGMSDSAVGADNAAYAHPLVSSPGGSWITRHDMTASGTPATFATVPSEVIGAGGYGFILPAGLAANRRGEVFIIEMDCDTLYMYKDLDGDGKALSAGETVKYATLHSGGTGVFAYMVFGLSAAKGGSLLAQVTASGASADAGIHWIADLNGNGTALGESGEKTLFHTKVVEVAYDYSPFASRR